MIKSNSNIEEKRAFEFTIEGFNKEGGTFWHYFEIPVNIFQKLCLEWWGGGDGREGGWKQGRGLKSKFFSRNFSESEIGVSSLPRVAADD